MVEAHIQSLNPVSPEFVPRALPAEETNGWSEPPTATPAAVPAPAPTPAVAPSNHVNNTSNGNGEQPSGWSEATSGDNEWQAGK